ncbi:MAG: glutamate racemase [Pseudomonadales bacterium]|jgi:glutamate racemase
MTIIVFDSGVGGLSVLREARMLIHNQQFIYVGDDAGFPYGDWEGEALTHRIAGLFDTLIDKYNPSLAIIACNTASTQIMPELRSRFDIPFVGIVPAIKPAAERTSSGHISVLATPGTIERKYTLNLVDQFASHVQVKLVGATKLARLAEEHLQGIQIDTNLLKDEIAPCFVEHEGKRTDIITLGCTHYPFLVNEMRKLAPWPVDWLDPAEAVARQAVRELQRTSNSGGACQSHLNENQKDSAIMTSPKPSPSTMRLLGGLGLQLHALNFPSLQVTSQHS